MRIPQFLWILVAFLAFLSVSLAEPGPAYTFTTIDVPFPELRATQVEDINLRRDVVGIYIMGFIIDEHDLAFVGSRSHVFPLPDLTPFGLNNARQMVGSFTDEQGSHGFVYDLRQGFVQLDVPGSQGTMEATAITDEGTVLVGTGATTNFLYADGVYTPILFPIPTAQVTMTGLNDARQIVGSYFDGTIWRGFLLEDDEVTAIDVPGALRTEPRDITADGLVVGTWVDEDTQQGFTWRDGVFTFISVPDAISTEVRGVNDAGVLCGSYQAPDEAVHGFVAIPTRPQTIAKE